MQKNQLVKTKSAFLRILDVREDKIFVIDCIRKTMPKWISVFELNEYECCTEEELLHETKMKTYEMDSLKPEQKCCMYQRFTLISAILPVVSDEKRRTMLLKQVAEEQKVSERTIRNYLCLYLVYQNITVFAPKEKAEKRTLTKDEKNIRWALNKFFYNKNKNSLTTAYTMMLKEKYCDVNGVLLPEYPSIHQFKYYYKKHKNMQTYYISRDGLKNYQRNNRPLLGDGVQEYASSVGMGMLDATVCDIYLVNEAGNLVGRPILTACIDAYSSLCCGYMLSWEGGTYSLRGLMVNILSNKVEWCRSHGVFIQREQWDSDKLPGIFVTDMGAEYKSETFEQIADVGCEAANCQRG